MRTLNISISDSEFNKFGLKNDKINFSDFIELISNELSKRNLNKSIQLSEKYGLSMMTMDEIYNEVREVRNNAKNNS
jgi:Sporulation inhibitor A